MLRSTIVTVLFSCALAGAAIAEDTGKTPAPTESGKPMAAADSGMQMGNKAMGPVKFAKAGSSDVMSSRLVGVSVYNNKNESVGTISDLAISHGQTISGVIVSVGGFLGMGKHYVLVEPSSITLSNDNGSIKAHMDTNRDTLKSAPAYTYNANKS